MIVLCVFVFLFAFNFLLLLTGGHGHIKYAVAVSKVEGWYKLPLVFYQSHMFSKYEQLFMNSFDNEAKYSIEFLANVEASLNASLAGLKTRSDKNFVEFPEKDGRIRFNTSNLCSGFEIIPSLITMRVNNKLYIFPPRIIYKIRKVRDMYGIEETKRNPFDKRK